MNVFIFCLILFFFSIPSFAKSEQIKLSNESNEPSYLKLEVSNGLSLEKAIELALGNNLEIKSKQSEVKQFEAQIKTAGARQNLFLEGSESRSENTYYGGVNYLLETGGKRKKRIEVAKQQFEAAKKDFEATVWNVRCTVRQLYTKLAVDLEWLKVKEERLAINEQLVNITKKRFDAGDVPMVDIKLAQQAVLNSRADLIAFKNELINDRINLNTKLSISPSSEWPVETSLQELSKIKSIKDKKELIDVSLAAKSELKQASFKIHSAEAELKLSKSLRIPNIQEGLYIVTSNALNTSTVTPDVFTTDIRYDANIELPIFNRQQGPISETKAKIEKYSNDKMLLMQQIAANVSTAYEKLKSIQEKLELAGKNVDSSKEITELIQEGYTVGRMNLLQVLSVKQNLKLAQDTYYTALIDLQSSVGELERAVGLPLSEVTL